MKNSRYSSQKRSRVRYVYIQPKRKRTAKVKHTRGFIMSTKPYPKNVPNALGYAVDRKHLLYY